MANPNGGGFVMRGLGSIADLFIPGDAFNPRAPSFGEGWTTSGWGRGFEGAQHGNYGPLLGEVGSVVGGRAIPIIGSQIGRRTGNWLGNLFGRTSSPTMPQFSSYGPYAPEFGGYQGLPPMAPQSDFTMPEFTDWEAETRPPTVQSQGQMVLPRGSVSNFMVGGFPVITGVRPGAGNYSGIGGNYKAVKKRDASN